MKSTPGHCVREQAPAGAARPNPSRYSHCTYSAATNGRDVSRNSSRGANGRCGRNMCRAWFRGRCARGPVRPRAEPHADSVARKGESAARAALTWRPPDTPWIWPTLTRLASVQSIRRRPVSRLLDLAGLVWPHNDAQRRRSTHIIDEHFSRFGQNTHIGNPSLAPAQRPANRQYQRQILQRHL
jgi:hypothetical protein